MWLDSSIATSRFMAALVRELDTAGIPSTPVSD
jgi:hypothetical protein